MISRLQYSDVALSYRKKGALYRTREGQRVMKQIGKCIREGGKVTCVIDADEVTGAETLNATLEWDRE